METAHGLLLETLLDAHVDVHCGTDASMAGEPLSDRRMHIQLRQEADEVVPESV
jgi:hypothetical protein